MNRLPLHKLGDFIEKRGMSVLGHCYKCNKIIYRTQQEAKKEAADMRKGVKTILMFMLAQKETDGI